jgi:hypothetical protein
VSQLLESTPPENAGLSVDDPAIEVELDRRFADGSGAIPWSELRAEE